VSPVVQNGIIRGIVIAIITAVTTVIAGAVVTILFSYPALKDAVDVMRSDHHEIVERIKKLENAQPAQKR
jgi:hypothetical protein